jgi:hypothetical protein
MTGRRVLARGAALLSLALCPACFSDYTYKAQFVEGFKGGAHKVSVLGVFKDGRMDFEAWDALAPSFSATLGGKCAAGYDTSFVAAHQTLAAAIDDVVRADGLDDDLLKEIAPAAQGDLLVVFTLAGHVEKARIDIKDSQPGGSMGGGGMGGGGAMGGGGPAGTHATMPSGGGHHLPASSTAALDLSATMFSPSQGASVAVVQLEYTGEDATEAVKEFAAKVRGAIPGSTCEGWNWSAPIDERRLREMVER